MCWLLPTMALQYNNCCFIGYDLWVHMLTYSWTRICLQNRICDSRWCSLYPSYREGDIDLRSTTSSPKNNDKATKKRTSNGHHIWAWPWKVGCKHFCIVACSLFLQGCLILLRSKVPGHNDWGIFCAWGFRGWKEKSLHWKWDSDQSIFIVSWWANIWSGFNYSPKDRSTSSWHSWGEVDVTTNE